MSTRALRHAAAAVSRENDQARTGREEWTATMELNGTPAFYSRDGNSLTGLNEPRLRQRGWSVAKASIYATNGLPNLAPLTVDAQLGWLEEPCGFFADLLDL